MNFFDRESFAVAEVSQGGTDTGYSSRCSTPPTPLNTGENPDDEQREQRRTDQESIINPLTIDGANHVSGALRSQSPSACSDSSNGSGHFPQGKNKYQSYQTYQRYNAFHYQSSQKHHPKAGYYYNNVGTDGYNNQSYEDNYGYNGRIRCQGNNGGHSNFIRKNERIPAPHGHHYTHNSSQPHEPYSDGRHGARHYSQGHYHRMEGRGRNWNNPKYPNAKNSFSNPPFHQQSNFFPNASHSGNIYHQLNSQHDLRETVWGFRRTLTDPAGTFSAPPGNNNGKWQRDHRVEAIGIPPELLNQSEWDALSLQVWNQFTKHQQLDTTFRAKMELKDRISHVIRVSFSLSLLLLCNRI